MQAVRSLAGKKVVVTGARGFIGSRLVRTLANREGVHVVALVRSKARNPWRNMPGVSASTDLSTLANAAVAINLAYDFSAPANELLAEFDGLVGACQSAGVGAFIQFSSIAVYDAWPGGDLDESSSCDGPGGIYKTTKRAMERRLADGRLPHTVLQPSIVYGAGSPQWTEKILDQARSGTIVLPDGPEGLCHAVHVDDVVEAAIRAARLSAHAGARYIISGPAPVGWRAFYSAHAALIGKPPPVLESLPDDVATFDSAPRVLPTLARSVLRAVRSRLSSESIARIRHWLAAAKGLGGPVRHYPSAGQLRLMRARGVCRMERAFNDLGFTPQIDFATGMRLVAEAMGQPALNPNRIEGGKLR